MPQLTIYLMQLNDKVGFQANLNSIEAERYDHQL
jgi:hypothetical protein